MKEMNKMADCKYRLWKCQYTVGMLRIKLMRMSDDEELPAEVRSKSLETLKDLDSAYKHLCNAENALGIEEPLWEHIEF